MPSFRRPDGIAGRISGFRTRNESGPENADEGNALIEFVFLAVMLAVPTLYSLLALAHAQAGAYAAVASAQQVVQLVDASSRDDVPSDGARRAAAFAAADYGFSSDQVTTTMSCSGDCEGQNAIDVTVSVAVDAPFLGWIAPHGVMTMTSSATSWSGAYE